MQASPAKWDLQRGLCFVAEDSHSAFDWKMKNNILQTYFQKEHVKFRPPYFSGDTRESRATLSQVQLLVCGQCQANEEIHAKQTEMEWWSMVQKCRALLFGAVGLFRVKESNGGAGLSCFAFTGFDQGNEMQQSQKCVSKNTLRWQISCCKTWWNASPMGVWNILATFYFHGSFPWGFNLIKVLILPSWHSAK